MDRHEWYAPPQIYTRDDSTGFWTAKPAIPPDSPLLLSDPHCDRAITKFNTVPSGDEPNVLEHKHQCTDANSEDGGCIKLQTDGESGIEISNTGGDFNVNNKRRRVEEDLSIDGGSISNGVVFEHKGRTHSPSLENSGILDDRVVAATNASLAEQVIEPTLVMFEVISMQYSLLGF